jgi:MFS family permease
LNILFLVRVVGLGPGVVGLLIALASAAALLGAALAGPLARRVGSARIIWLSTVATSPFALLVPLTYSGWRVVWFAVSATVCGFGQIVYAVTQLSYRQALVPGRILGRVNATMRFAVMGMLPLGGVLAGVLAQAIGVRPTLWILGVGLSLAPLPLVLSPLRGLRDVEHEPAGAHRTGPAVSPRTAGGAQRPA